MAYDEALADRLRQHMLVHGEVTEKKMFGGICFLLNGNMLCGVESTRYMFRVGKEQYDSALQHPEASPMDFTGRPMGGFVFVDPDQVDDVRFAEWIAMAEKFVGSLPPK